MGPALLPESLERLKRKDAVATIRDGRAATQMPAFGAALSAAEIDALAGWIYSPVSPAPAGARPTSAPPSSPTRPAACPTPARARWPPPMNLFIVVEAGDHHVSVLDGDRMERIHRFPSRYALHGGPKFTPDGRYVFFASRDGWVSKFDIWNLKVVAEVRATSTPATPRCPPTGATWRWANLPGNLVIFDADSKLLKVIDGRNLKGDAGLAPVGGVRRRRARASSSASRTCRRSGGFLRPGRPALPRRLRARLQDGRGARHAAF
jgi:hypothetical protein